MQEPWVQIWTMRWALGCGKFLPGLAWLLVSKTGPPLSSSLYLWGCHNCHGLPILVALCNALLHKEIFALLAFAKEFLANNFLHHNIQT